MVLSEVSAQAWYDRVPNPGLWADVVMVVHAAIVLFVILGLFAVLVWGWLKNPGPRSFIRNIWFRGIHLGIIVWVLIQALRGRYCPLTYWEQDLRSAAGQDTYDVSFIDYWVSTLIYYDFPQWVFQTGYLLFTGLTLYSLWKWPPVWKGSRGSNVENNN